MLSVFESHRLNTRLNAHFEECLFLTVREHKRQRHSYIGASTPSLQSLKRGSNYRVDSTHRIEPSRGT
jgi:hypothetical protein